jgi:hypothetical protein
MDKLDNLPDAALREQEWKALCEIGGATRPIRSSFISVTCWQIELRFILGRFDLPRTPMVLNFPHITRRVAAQRSQFIVLGSDPLWLSEEFKTSDSAIRSITIEGTRARAIRAELRECGISESVIFPDLDGLGRELNQLWQDRQ